MGTIGRFFKPPERSFFLLGPRGTGKSTWIKDNIKNHVSINLLDAGAQRHYSADPMRLKLAVEAKPHAKIVVIDEIQRVPEVLPVIHGLIEEKRGWQFIMTGSSARKLKRTGADLLGGRASLETMHPFMAAELGDEFNLKKALRTGTIPLIWADPDPEKALNGYVDLYLKEEVQQEGALRNVGAFSRFLEAMSFSHGAVLNKSNIARECHVDMKTVSTYIQILEDLLLSFRVPVFTRRAKREAVQHPKFYFFDAGVFQTLRPTGALDKTSEMEGPGLEGLVAQHLRAWSAYGGNEHSLYYWRTRSGVEVDFIVYGPKEFWAIEVKNTSRIRDEDLRGLQTFLADYPEARGLFLYRGTEHLKRQNIHCLPCEEFLRQLIPARSLLQS